MLRRQECSRSEAIDLDLDLGDRKRQSAELAADTRMWIAESQAVIEMRCDLFDSMVRDRVCLPG